MKTVAKWFSTCVLALSVTFGAFGASAREQRSSERTRAARVVFKTGQPGAGAKQFFFKKGGRDEEPKGGHSKGSRPSTEEKHQRGDERRIRDQGGEKKDNKHDDGRNAWKKRRGG